MPGAQAHGVELFYEVAGSGDPLVLVHGSWGDHRNWIPVLPALTEHFRVLTLRPPHFRVLIYDRHGHSRSERPPGQGSRYEDEEDLAALTETLDRAPAHVAGSSFGASTTLGPAARRPDLFQAPRMAGRLRVRALGSVRRVHPPQPAELRPGDVRLRPQREGGDTRREGSRADPSGRPLKQTVERTTRQTDHSADIEQDRRAGPWS